MCMVVCSVGSRGTETFLELLGSSSSLIREHAVFTLGHAVLGKYPRM